MKKHEIKVGGHYLARVSGKIVTVRVDAIRERSDYKGRTMTVYDVANLTTGRRTTFRSAAKFRSEVPAEEAAARKRLEENPFARVMEDEQSLPFDAPNPQQNPSAIPTSESSSSSIFAAGRDWRDVNMSETDHAREAAEHRCEEGGAE